MKFEVDLKIVSHETMTIEADTPEDVRKKLSMIPDYGVDLEVEVMEVRDFMTGEPA
jgi:hypothetical protein